MSDKNEIDRIAASVADATPVDWQMEEGASPEMASRLSRLHVIERIAAAHRASGETTQVVPLLAWGHLRAVEKIGEGSYGTVYRAIDTILDREVALKLRSIRGASGDSRDRDADAAATRRYLDEARRLARVRHPNVLRVHGADVHDGVVGLWCDLVRGRTLEDRVASDGPLGAEEAALVGLDLCRALAAVHAAGLVHGDVKASNVMREEGGAIILLDFGSGRDTLRSGAAAEAAFVTGTPLTLSPEALRGEAASPAADLYALGVLLYRLVSGRYPVPAGTIDELFERHARGERVPLRDVRADLPAAFVRVVERALARDPRDRFESAGAMEAALAAAMQPAAPLAPAASAADRAPGTHPGSRSRRSHPRGRAGLALAAAFALAVAALAARERANDHAPQTGAASKSAASEFAGSSLDVDASLYVAGAAGAAPLATGGAVAPGDQLFLEIEGSAPMHVYVLDEDLEGNLFVLFPVAGLDLRNPLPAGTRHRLPGRFHGEPHDWQVTSAGGRETILVVTSREPLAPLEQQLASIPSAEAGAMLAYAELDPAALAGLRGIAGMTPSRDDGDARAGSRLAQIAREFRAMGERSGVWLREFELANP